MEEMAEDDVRNKKSQHSAPGLNDILRLIDFEIDQIREEARRQNWSTWALLGGLASLAWLITIEHDKAIQINIVNTLFTVILIQLVKDFALTLKNFLEVDNFTKTWDRRYRLSMQLFSQARLTVFVEFAQTIFFLWAFWNIRQVLSGIFLLFIMYWFFHVAFSIFAIVMSYCNLPFPTFSKNDNIRTSLFYAFTLMALAFGILGMGQSIFGERIVLKTTELRMGGLLFGVVTIIGMLSKSQIVSPLLNPLIELKRNILLNNIIIETAQHKLEMILLGATVTDILHNEFLCIIDALKKVELISSAADRKVQELTTIIDHADPSYIDEDARANIDKIVKQVDYYNKQVIDLLQQISKWTKRFENKANLLFRPDIAGDIEKMENIIGIAFERATNNAKSFLSGYNEILKKVEAKN